MTKYDPRKNAEGYNDPTPYAAEKHIHDAHCNGDMHAALDYAAKIKHAQKDFLTSQGIHAIID